MALKSLVLAYPTFQTANCFNWLPLLEFETRTYLNLRYYVIYLGWPFASMV